MQEPEKINVLQAIQIAVRAWEVDVKPQTIQNCFLHCGIKTHVQGAVTIQKDNVVDSEVIQDLELQIQQFNYTHPMHFRDFVDYPGEDNVEYVPIEDEILAQRLQPSQLDTIIEYKFQLNFE